eukprot:EC820915.1.p1 GENE.EC820915.1~~EC820915.1.p1  ORF type:complete len:161 (+),score=80.04 EC820915.1:13-495(+)
MSHTYSTYVIGAKAEGTPKEVVEVKTIGGKKFTYIFLKDKQHFSIVLKNTSNFQAGFKTFVDEKPSGFFVVAPNQTCFIERPVQAPGKFTIMGNPQGSGGDSYKGVVRCEIYSEVGGDMAADSSFVTLDNFNPSSQTFTTSQVELKNSPECTLIYRLMTK